MAIGGFITYWLCSLFGDGIPQMLARMGICLVVPNIVFILFNFKREEFRGTVNLAKSILKREV